MKLNDKTIQKLERKYDFVGSYFISPGGIYAGWPNIRDFFGEAQGGYNMLDCNSLEKIKGNYKMKKYVSFRHTYRDCDIVSILVFKKKKKEKKENE